MANYPSRPISAPELRLIFNESRFEEKLKTGELSQKILKEGHPSPPQAHEPTCTRSQIIAYCDTNDNRIALVHQYLRPDGTIGASGRPDPKTILIDGELRFVVDPSKAK
jgi:hypothetical protein